MTIKAEYTFWIKCDTCELIELVSGSPPRLVRPPRTPAEAFATMRMKGWTGKTTKKHFCPKCTSEGRPQQVAPIDKRKHN